MRAIHIGIGKSFVIVVDRMSCSFASAHVAWFGSPHVSYCPFLLIRRLGSEKRYMTVADPVPGEFLIVA